MLPTSIELAVVSEPPRRLPKWLKREVPKGNANHFTSNVLDELRLETVCENAKCPNRMECYSQKTATFMILGNVCTRPCGFCAVSRGRPEDLEDDEPQRVAEAARRMDLKHVVITSVTRDDLPDHGAEHFYRCVVAVREKTGASVEVLTPDFVGHPEALDRVVDAAPTSSTTTPKPCRGSIVVCAVPNRIIAGRSNCCDAFKCAIHRSAPKAA